LAQEIIKHIHRVNALRDLANQLGVMPIIHQLQHWQCERVRVIPKLAKVLPDKAMNAMDDALSLNALSFDLDMAMAQYLQSHFPGEPINRDNYALAYRNVGRIEDRKHQIDIISHLGDQLADVIKIRGIGMLISLSRRPAKLAGLLA